MNDRPMTVRLPSAAYTTLVEVSQRTRRSRSLLLNEAIIDLAHAYVRDPDTISRYAATGERASARVSIIKSAAAAASLSSVCADSTTAPAVVARAAWLRWLDIHDVDDVVDYYGALRPPPVTELTA